jgi:diguanylate cyclase (GGDEF)-like protein/PAS domain S-box-containing protein
MSESDSGETSHDQLRQRAETRLEAEDRSTLETPPEDVARLLYDLHTHQIELEMQNEELRHAQHELLKARDRYIRLYDLAPVGYLTISAKGLMLETNQTFVNMLGMERQHLINQPLSAHIVQPDQDAYYLFVSQMRKAKQQKTCELRMSRQDQDSTSAANVIQSFGAEERSWFWVRIDSRPLLNGKGEVSNINLSVSDITNFKLASDKLEHLATYDQLTHLPNRYLLETELNHRINAAKRFDEKFAILFIDLDNFKFINDTMGHAYGDILLQSVAKQLTAHLRDYDMVARFGGDEFVLLMPQIKDNTEVVAVVDKIIKEFSSVFYLDKEEAFITTSIGISIFPDDGKTVGELLQHADAAMYRAKDAGRGRYCFFTQAMNDELRRHQLITSELRSSLAKQEFSLNYQPLVDPQTGNIKSCEALIRWLPVDGELISPTEFIPVAEQSELINRIGEWVINEACRQRAEWKEMGLLDFRIDINLSGRQFLQNNFMDILERYLAKYHLSASEIGIELTENVLIQAGKNNSSNLNNLNESGMQISIDDFGTGYSSLSCLRRLPVHNLKIDQEFIRDAPRNDSDRCIMEAIVAVGHRLGLKVIAEGIETEEQHKLAREIGCDLGQGFFLHKPMESNKLYTLLARQYELEE